MNPLWRKGPLPSSHRRLRHSSRPGPGLLALLVGGAGLLLYAWTAGPSIVALYDDSLEFQLVCPTFGIAHPTGYPLYTLLCGLWSRVLFPLGNWAWRVNLFSALTGAGAVALASAVAWRLAGGSLWAGLAAAVAFGLSPTWWQQTTVAEVYALHILLVLGILWFALDLEAQPRPTGPIGPAGRNQKPPPFPTSPGTEQLPALVPLFAALGLALAHHRTVVLLAPGLALYLWTVVPRAFRPQRAWLRWGGALLAPLLLYLYIPLRAAMGVQDLNQDYVNTWAGFWRHVLALGYTGFFQDNPLGSIRGWSEWLAFYRGQLGWLGLALAAVGTAVGLADSRTRRGWLLVVWMGVGTGGFAALYRVADAEVFALPAVLGLALAAGRGTAAATRWLGQGSPRTYRRWLQTGTGALLLLLLLLNPLGRGGPIDRSDDWAVHDYAVAMAKVAFPPESRVVGLRGQVTALQYMQRAEGLGRNAVPVARDDETARRIFVAQGLAQGWPIYLTQELPGIERQYSFSGHGPLVRVWPRGEARPGSWSTRLDVVLLDGRVQIRGYDLVRLLQAGGPTLRLVLYWQPTEPLERSLKVSLRALREDGTPALGPEGRPVVADRFPLRQVYPSWAWLPGEVVRDVHDLPIRGKAAEKTAQLLVVVYDGATVEELGRFQIPVR